MKVNIVLLAKDRAKLTIQCFDSLAANTSSELFNLTIVDDESDWAIHEIGNQCFEKYIKVNVNWTVLRIGRSKGITGQARNLGIYWAEKYWGRGDYLYLSDNDVYFTPGWLEKLVQVRKAWPEMKVMGGWNHPFLQPSHVSYGPFTVATHDAVAGASQLMRWDTYDKYGPFDAHAKGVGQSEDWAFCQKIIKDGGQVGSVYPRVVLNCGMSNTFGQPSPGADLMLKELQEAKRQYPDLYWE